MPNQSGKIILVLVLILLVLGGAFYFSLPFFKKESTEQIPSPSLQSSGNVEKTSKTFSLTKDYYSKNLKISFKVPKDAQVEEKFINIEILSSNGKFSVTRNGTNYESSKDYYGDLKEKNKLTPLEYSEDANNGYDYVLVLDEDPNNKLKNKKSYFVYADYAVYIFSTSDESLYPVLDQIVQSFEYKP